MDAIATLRTLRRGDYSATVEGGRLKLRGPAKPSEDLYASILQHRDAIVRLVEGEIVVDEREVFEIVCEFFGKGERGAA